MTTHNSTAEAANLRGELLARGYTDLPEYKGIRAGSRVHHSRQRHIEATVNGTAAVLYIMERSPSPWSQSWGGRDVEIIVERDKPLVPGMSTVTEWANYHTALVTS